VLLFATANPPPPSPAVAPIEVYFGDVKAPNASLASPTAIKGTVPPSPNAPDTLVDIEIRTGSGSFFHRREFRYLADYTVQLDSGPRF
jgi:hypothetical protein